MALDIDVVIDTDTAHVPFGEDIRFGRQGLERWPVELFEQLPARDAEPADRPLFVEPPKQLADRRVQLVRDARHQRFTDRHLLARNLDLHGGTTRPWPKGVKR